MPRIVHCLALVLTFSSLSPAQDSWTELKPGTDPGPRYQHAMAFDSARGRIVLFGGRTKQAVLNDTWEFDGFRWSQMNPPNPPPGISLEPKMTYDSNRRTMVMIRLESATTRMVVWEYDGADWKSLAPAHAPMNDPFTLAYDQERKLTLLIKDGGNPSSPPETWEWDGNAWLQRHPAQHPPGVLQNAMAFDPVRRKVILYGGYSTGGGSEASSETHEWDGKGWTGLTTATEPPLRHSYGAALDALGRVIVFGGTQDSTIYGDTWAFSSAPAAAVDLIGSGCPGSHRQVPALVPSAGPILGNTFRCDVRDALPLAPGLFFLDQQANSLGVNATGGGKGTLGY